MSRTRIYVVCAVVVALSAVAILATDSSGDGGVAEPATTTTSTLTPTTTTTTTTPPTTTTTTTTTVAPDVVQIAEELALLGIEGQARQVVMLGTRGDIVEGLVAGLGDTCIGGIFVASNAGNWEPGDSIDAAGAAIEEVVSASGSCAAYPPLRVT